MKSLFDPFPVVAFGINVTLPSVLVAYLIIIALLNATLWGSFGIYEFVKVVS